ncbi:MAG: hypothetical protein LBG52_09395 [Candidatus Peribacteria bacterium]|nr:hypothetical protein [Candidatus Peribacteria bacterium]
MAVDDSVQDRLWSHTTKSDIIGQHYSGNHKSIVNGVDVITLFWVVGEQKLPINFKIFSTENNKTKHTLFLEMIDEILSW